LAKTNYQFEKRQRDLAKKRKQEEKRQRKLAGRTPVEGESTETSTDRPESAIDDAAGDAAKSSPAPNADTR
jgi:hypothetical protein